LSALLAMAGLWISAKPLWWALLPVVIVPLVDIAVLSLGQSVSARWPRLAGTIEAILVAIWLFGWLLVAVIVVLIS
jgi:hypothetical protein